MHKKYITLIVCIVALTAFASSAAAKGETVLLVSDNEADLAVADTIQNVKSFTVVTTPWGEFNESVVAEIEVLNPTRVIIIGGTEAVPSDYDTVLATYSPIRLDGEDRYETASKAFKHFEKDFKGKGVMMAYGYDNEGIQKALKKAKGMGWFVLFIKTDAIPTSVEDAIDKLTSGDVEVFESPDSEIDKIIEKLEKKKKKVKLYSLNESERTERALHQMEEAQEAIDETTNEIEECVSPKAEKDLSQAQAHLEMAQTAYDEGNYGKAFGLAVSAEHQAKNAKRKAKHHLCLGGTERDGKNEDHNEEVKFCGEIEALTCPNEEAGKLRLVGSQTFNLIDDTDYEDGINGCEDLDVSDTIKIEAKNDSGTLVAKKIGPEDHCEGDGDADTTTTTTLEPTTTTTLESTTSTTTSSSTTSSSTTTTSTEPSTTTTAPSTTTTTTEPTSTSTSSTTTSTTQSTTTTTVG